MAVFPLQVFTREDAVVAFNADYRSSPLGVRFAGQPKGVYVGFEPSTLGSVLTLIPDPAHGYSCVKVDSGNDPGGMDVFVTSSVMLDFAGQPDVDFPMNVMLRVNYEADGATPTTAEIFSRSATVAVSATEALICVVDGPAASLTVVSDPSLIQQDAPLAYGHVDFGFMPGGSIENLRAAADIVDEVIAARTGIDSAINTSLDGRIDADYSAAAMASRLALVFRGLRSNDYAVVAGEQNFICSGSFTEIDRAAKPLVTLDGDGDETTEGALAGPNDTERNVVLVVDATTGYRPIDDPTDRRVIFGRLTGPNEQGISGDWQFLNASKDVNTIDGAGQATVEVEVGDTILAPDGKYYEIETIVNDNSLELATAFQGASASSASATVRRWQVALKKVVSGVEQDAALAADATLRFFFPAFVSMERGNADWSFAAHTSMEREPLPAATTSVPGTVRLAESGALLGEVNIQNAGAPLGGGPFHTVNFNAANASVVASPTVPGEVEVVEIGPQGVPGLPGPSGGPGNPGAPGPGYSAINTYEESGEFPGTPGMTVPFSYTQNMGHNIRYLHGNASKFRDGGFFSTPGDRLDVLNVSVVSPTEGRIEGTIGGAFGDVFLTTFLSSAGD